MIQTRAEFRFDNPVESPTTKGIFSNYWQRALGSLVIFVNTLIASRNTGLTAAIATGATLEHGMSRKPTFVTLAPQDATPTNFFVDNITTTSFRINYTGGGTHSFGWTA